MREKAVIESSAHRLEGLDVYSLNPEMTRRGQNGLLDRIDA
jgi:hypothetical protein